MWLNPGNVAGPVLSRYRELLFFQGLLADRPAAAAVPMSFTYLATDNGITYGRDGDGWHQIGYETNLESALALGAAYTLQLNIGATDTYPGTE
jgi:hypothetical protein